MVKTIANIFQFTCTADTPFLLLLFTPLFIAFFGVLDILGLIVTRMPQRRRANKVMAMTRRNGQHSSTLYLIILTKKCGKKTKNEKKTQILTEIGRPNPIERCRQTVWFNFHFIYFIIIVYSVLHCIISYIITV